MLPLCLDPFETARLAHRPLTEDDLDALVALYCDAETMQYIGDGKPRAIWETKGLLDAMLAHYERHGLGLFAAVEKATGALIGCCGFAVSDTGEGPEVGIAYVIDRERWNQGFATEAVRGFLARAQAHPAWPWSYLIACVHLDNRAGKRVALNAGMALWQVRQIEGRPTRVYRIDLKGR